MAELTEQEKSEIKNKMDTLVVKQTDDNLPTSISSQTENKSTNVVIQNGLMAEISQNQTAVDLAKEQYNDLRNQKSISKKISNVVNKKTNADIEQVDVAVEEQKKDNKVKRQEIKNELLKLYNDKIYLKREQKHRLLMQRYSQRKEKYADLLARNHIDYMPNTLQLTLIIFFDAIVNLLNSIGKIIGQINKDIIKGILIILILLFIFVAPFRDFIFSIIK